MSKLTLQELRRLREDKRKQSKRALDSGGETRIVVGMATCGIAAGAEATADAIRQEAGRLGLSSVTVSQSGCMGLCHSEPTVEVAVPGMPAVIYGGVDAEMGKKIVAEHVKGGRLLDNAIFDRPSADITDL